jgi:energy-coupling factor transport system ATP-binding protein
MNKRKLPKRTIAAAVIILFTIPLTIFIGMTFLDDRRYYFISMLIILQTMIPFALVFESRKPQARELVIIAVLCAIAVAGRAAFFMLPQFKPVVALVIIAGVAFGGEAGFLVGAMTGFVSNFFFGQGPWTPWQMFAFGVIGFLAGILFRKGVLRRGRIPLSVFGAIATVVIYGGIMNPASVLMFQPNPTREMIVLAYSAGLPFDLIHAAATATFLLTISQAMLEKLDRIKVKYGLVE